MDYSLDSQRDDFFSISPSNSNDSFHSATFLPLNDILLSNFSDIKNNFKAIHINAQSIPAHYPDMLTSFCSVNVDAILVSESWLKPCLPSTSYCLPGYKLIRNDRTGRGGGGVAIYLRLDIPFTIISTSSQPPTSDSPEYLLIEVQLSRSKILLGVFYCPSLHLDYFSSFEQILEVFPPNYAHTILMGDFNTCMFKGDHRTRKLASILDGCNMTMLPLNPTHSAPGCIPSLLDLIFVSSPNFVVKHGQCSADIFSYHDLIYVAYNVRPPKKKRKVLLQRSFGAMDMDCLVKDAENIDWSLVFDAGTVDDKIKIFDSLLIDLYDKHAPVKPVKIKHLPAPWLSEDIKALINLKHSAKAKYKRCNSVENRERYIKIRNRCNKTCRDAQRRYINSSVENGDPRKIWKFLRSLGVGKNMDPNVSCSIDEELLNQHFTSSTPSIDSAVKLQTLQSLSSLPAANSPTFSLKPFTVCEVKRHVMSISSNAVGDDGISRKMITSILSILAPILAHIFNFSIDSSLFPSTWKDAIVIPLPKSLRPKSVSDYRPISILPFLSKVLERLIHLQLTNYVTKNNLLSPFQSGFRAGHSTTTALVKVTDDIRFGMDNKQLTVLTLLDFSNAFNVIDHDILLSMLPSFNLAPSLVGWFRSYLGGRRQRVKIADNFSSWSNISAGVPQGGVLSPLLFALFINSITHSISSRHHMYADDLQIYTHSTLDNLPSAIVSTNRDLAIISTWTKHHGLHINPAKTQTIIIGSPGLVSRVDWDNLSLVQIEGVSIPYSKTVKNLGLHLDDNLSWHHQMKEVGRKVFSTWHSLRRLRNLLPIHTKVKIAESLILCLIDYGDTCYINLTEAQLNKLERLQNLSLRFIFGLRKFDHISEFRSKLKWLPIRFRRNARILSLLYCILFDPKTPIYLQDKFVFRSTDCKELRSAGNLLLETPIHHTKYFHSSFTVKAITLWNSLPYHIKQAKTLNSFKSLVKNYYLNICSL